MAFTRLKKRDSVSSSNDSKNGSHAELNFTIKNISPTFFKFIATKQADKYCHEVHQYVSLLCTVFTDQKHGMLVGKIAIGYAARKVVHTLLLKKVLNTCTLPRTYRHSKQSNDVWRARKRVLFASYSKGRLCSNQELYWYGMPPHRYEI